MSFGSTDITAGKADDRVRARDPKFRRRTQS